MTEKTRLLNEQGSNIGLGLSGGTSALCDGCKNCTQFLLALIYVILHHTIPEKKLTISISIKLGQFRNDQTDHLM